MLQESRNAVSSPSPSSIARAVLEHITRAATRLMAVSASKPARIVNHSSRQRTAQELGLFADLLPDCLDGRAQGVQPSRKPQRVIVAETRERIAYRGMTSDGVNGAPHVLTLRGQCETAVSWGAYP